MDTARVLRREGNLAVVQLEKRRFPALAAQGIKFYIFVDNVRHALAAENYERCKEELEYALAEMETALAFYRDTLLGLKLELPWSEADTSE